MSKEGSEVTGQAVSAAAEGGRSGGDAALVRAAHAGDAAAFGALYERHRNAVYRFCLARTGSAHDAEDLTADVFVKAIRSLGRYEERGAPFVAFLYRIARNAAIDRARTRKDGVSIDELPDDLGSDHDVERAAISGADRAALLAALAKLRDDHRTVLVLRFIEGYSGLEIARIMGRSEGAVRILQHRAVEKLRRAFGVGETLAKGARP